MDLGGAVMLVTGSGSGIGEAVARRAAAAGARVVVADIAAGAAGRVAADIAAGGGQAADVAADVSQPAEAERAIGRALEAFGRIDVVVNNAGIVRDAQLVKMDERQWDQVIGVNLTGTYLVSHAAAPHMLRQGRGRIVNIASRSLLGNFGQANYAASKAAVVGLTKSLALELGPGGVNCNAIAPGYIETPIMRDLPAELRMRAKESAPLRRVGSPDDVASAVLFLSSEHSSYITGQCLFVCGGRSLNAALENWA
jgi:NAD(P)-dependent dehydrogenase (short-subunit alcohol dehydrogenase family)